MKISLPSHYLRKDLLSDVILLAVVSLVAFGLFHVLKSPAKRAYAAWIQRAHRDRGTAVENGTPIDFNWTVHSLDTGQDVAVSTLKGQVMFLNFWATWCGPCRMEMPSIEKLVRRYKGAGVAFLCVSTESEKDLRLFLRNHKMDVPLYTVRRMPLFFNKGALPTTYIVSRAGNVALSRIGAGQWDSAKVLHLMDELLADTARR